MEKSSHPNATQCDPTRPIVSRSAQAQRQRDPILGRRASSAEVPHLALGGTLIVPLLVFGSADALTHWRTSNDGVSVGRGADRDRHYFCAVTLTRRSVWLASTRSRLRDEPSRDGRDEYCKSRWGRDSVRRSRHSARARWGNRDA